MSDKNKYKCIEFKTSIGEVRSGSVKYVGAMVKVMEGFEDHSLLSLGKEMMYMGYAMGVIAGKYSDFGIEGFTLLLNGIKYSLEGENRKEELQFAIWDEEGGLHTSEEEYRTVKGGEK